MPLKNSQLVKKIESSSEYREFDKAFRDATGLPLEITEVNQVKFALCTRSHGNNDFCRMMASSGYRCDTCRLLNQKITLEIGLENDAPPFSSSDSTMIGLTEKNPLNVSRINRDFWDSGPKTFECFAGMCESMIPIRVNEEIVGFLKTGQVLLQKPSKKAFRNAVQMIKELKLSQEEQHLEESYFKTPVLPPQQYQAMVMLLKTFSTQLSTIAEKLMIEIAHSDPLIVQKAKEVMRKRYSEALTLEEIASSVPVSHHHLSRKFKESTGIGAMDYLKRVRIEHAKEQLIKRDIGIAEIAFAIGFQSLAPFNKAFKEIIGMTPKVYRSQIQ